jgi:hypothetical protein
MKYYKLVTATSQYASGTIFTFKQKHAFISSLPWQASRDIVWETIEIWN